MKKIYLLGLVASLIVVCSCGRKGEIEYLPYQEEPDGKYGLVSPEGKVLMSEKFKLRPTVVTEGRFWALNSDGYYELYEASEEPRRLGNEFRYVSPFWGGRAIVAERDKHISIIDRNGETVADLKKIGEYTPDYITGMSEGHAVFAVDTLQGVIDYKGEITVRPRYYAVAPMHDGMMVAVDRSFAMNSEASEPSDKSPKGYASVINRFGEVALKISSKKYPRISDRVYGELLPVAEYKEKSYRWGIIDMKGEVVVRPAADCTEIGEVQGENYTFRNEDGQWGVRSIKGETLVKPRYAGLFFAGDGVLMTSKDSDVVPSGGILDHEGEFISLTGSAIEGKEYLATTGMIPTSFTHAFIKTGDDRWKIISCKGEAVDNAPKIASVSLNFGSEIIQSDFIDIQEFLSAIDFSAEGVDSLTFGSSVKTVLGRQARYFSSSNQPKASDYASTKTVYISRNVCGQTIGEEIIFPTTLSHQTYTTKTVWDSYSYYDYWYQNWYTNYYTYDKTVPAGFQFSSSTPSAFELTFDNYGVLRGKLRQLYKKLASRFKGMGSVIGENSGATTVDIGNGRKAIVYIDGHKVVARWGSLSPSDLDISKYYNSKETIDISDEDGGSN